MGRKFVHSLAPGVPLHMPFLLLAPSEMLPSSSPILESLPPQPLCTTSFP